MALGSLGVSLDPSRGPQIQNYLPTMLKTTTILKFHQTIVRSGTATNVVKFLT